MINFYKNSIPGHSHLSNYLVQICFSTPSLDRSLLNKCKDDGPKDDDGDESPETVMGLIMNRE